MFDEVLVPIAFMIGLIALIMAPIAVAGYYTERYSCEVRSRSFEGHEFSLAGGCMVKHRDRWIPLENIRGFGD